MRVEAHMPPIAVALVCGSLLKAFTFATALDSLILRVDSYTRSQTSYSQSIASVATSSIIAVEIGCKWLASRVHRSRMLSACIAPQEHNVNIQDVNGFPSTGCLCSNCCRSSLLPRRYGCLNAKPPSREDSRRCVALLWCDALMLPLMFATLHW